jgi:hypothetical protein
MYCVHPFPDDFQQKLQEISVAGLQHTMLRTSKCENLFDFQPSKYLQLLMLYFKCEVQSHHSQAVKNNIDYLFDYK